MKRLANIENISRLREAEYRKQFSPCQWKEIEGTNENLLFISTFADFSNKRRLISIFRVNWAEFASREPDSRAKFPRIVLSKAT